MYAEVIFENEKYNYSTAMNEKISDKEAKDYFVGKFFNMGNRVDDMQKCIDCKIIRE